MATVSGTSLDAGSAVAAEERHRRVKIALLAGAIGVCILYRFLPERFVFVREFLLYVGLDIAAVAAVFLGVHWFKPKASSAWLCIAVGLAWWTVGDLFWGIYVVGGEDRWSSSATEAFYLPGYGLIAAGLVIAARRRFAEPDYGAVLDAVVLTQSAGLLLWVYMIDPLRDSTEGFEAAISVTHLLGDLLLLALAARFVVGPAWRIPAFRWLAAALALTLLGDATRTLTTVGRIDVAESSSNALFLAGMALFGVAALDPSMRDLTERSYDAAPRPGLVRLVLIACAPLLPIVVVITHSVADKPQPVVAVGVSFAVLAGAGLARWVGRILELQWMVSRKAMLREYGHELLETEGRQELASLAERTARRLVPRGTAEVRLAGEPSGPAHARRAVVDITVRGRRVGELVATGPSEDLFRTREALSIVASQLALALERDRLLETEREAAETLAEQNEALRKLDEMKDQFVSTVSHELRTPLTPMIGYLEVTLSGEVGELNEDQRHFLEIVNRNCLRLNKLIDEILFMSRSDSGRLTFEPQWVSLAELGEASVVTARFAAEKREVQLVYTARPDLPRFWGDPTRLTQVFDNLLSNAIKFTPAGGTVELAVMLHDDEVLHVELADSGVGIPEDELGHLFERFFRASTSATTPGTGLGLSIVQSILQAHGGTISVSSEVGVGTTFSVDLPLPGMPGAPAAAPTEAAL